MRLNLIQMQTILGANMKRNQSLTYAVIACGLALALTATLNAAQTVVDGAAKVIRMKGSARYTTGNNVWQPVKLGAVLKPGIIIQTSKEAGSFVDLALGDGNAIMPSTASGAVYTPSIPTSTSTYTPKAEQDVVRVTEDSALGIDKLSWEETGADVVTDTQLDLKQGRIIGTVKKLTPASRYEIKMPNGVAGIRGTIYDISANGVVRVFVGSVVVAWVGSDGSTQTKVVGAGKQFDTRTGEVTPIKGGDFKMLQAIIVDLRSGGLRRGESNYTIDQTIYMVSPVRGGK
jgi:hypothetical protein